VRFYYFGVSYTHGCTDPVNSPNNYSGIGLATLPVDRYAGWQAGTHEGRLTTRPLRFAGRELHLNLDASRGEARVAFLDADGRPLPGFSAEDCRPICADSLDHVVAWGDDSDLAALAGKEIQVQFSLRQAVLYTWQFR
jgi:hypothetical protein